MSTWPSFCSHWNSGGSVQLAASMRAVSSSRRMRGTFSVMPPPVMWAMPFTTPGIACITASIGLT